MPLIGAGFCSDAAQESSARSCGWPQRLVVGSGYSGADTEQEGLHVEDDGVFGCGVVWALVVRRAHGPAVTRDVVVELTARARRSRQVAVA